VDWKNFLWNVHSKIIPLKKEEISIPSILAAAVLIVTVVATALDVLDKWAESLGGYLIAPHSHHYVAKGVTVLLAFVLLYLALFVYHASAIAVGAALKSQTMIEGLEREKQALKEKSNYRDQLAAAVGMRVREVHRECIISNEEGDCVIHEHEKFEVLGLALGDVVRRQISQCEFHIKDDDVAVQVRYLPDPTAVNVKMSRKLDYHIVHIFFEPALERTDTKKPIELQISKKVRKGFHMFREDIPKDWEDIEREPMESMAHLVLAPTDQLDISVEFPEDYRIPEQDLCLRVKYGFGQSRHREEEMRLEKRSENGDAKSLRTFLLANGKSKVVMTVNQPLLGLCYYLYWIPKSRAKA